MFGKKHKENLVPTKWRFNGELLMRNHLWGHTLELLPPKFQDVNLKVYVGDFPTQKKVVHVILVLPSGDGWKFWVIYRLDPSYTVFFSYTHFGGNIFFHHEWNTRPSSEKPWHWIPCRLVYGAKVHDLMPLQTNLYSLRGKKLTNKISAYFAKRCCLNKIQNTWRRR